MVAQTIELPNVKKMFLPEPGFFMCDSDLAQADAQVVAWDANDEPLMEFFKAARDDDTLDLHGNNAADIFGGVGNKEHPQRKKAKAGVHAVNYHVRPRTLARTLGITVHEAESFIDRWFDIHPAIKEWHRSVQSTLETTRVLVNKFGNRRVVWGRINTPTALSEALAWIPQSTVALVINRAWLNLERLNDPDIFVSLQVHDSLVYQMRQLTFRRKLPLVEEAFKIEIPYDDPLIIPAGLEYSADSWGDKREADWLGNFI